MNEGRHYVSYSHYTACLQGGRRGRLEHGSWLPTLGQSSVLQYYHYKVWGGGGRGGTDVACRI